MEIEYDDEKRAITLKERGLDFARAREVFAGVTYSEPDTRKIYPEARTITIGYLDTRIIVMVWTQRGENRRMISIRKANEREIKKYSGLHRP